MYLILSDRDIKKYMADNLLKISPLEDYQIQPASVDLRLGNSFLVIDPGTEAVSMDEEVTYRSYVQDTFILEPYQFVLATTMEYISMKEDLTAFVEGRSSIGRMGLFVENAGWVDPGFKGEITLELYNASNIPIILQAGRRICQLVFARTNTFPEKMYNGKYQGQKGATGTRIYLDKETLKNRGR